MDRMITSATIRENTSLVVLQTPFHPGDLIEVTLKKISNIPPATPYPLHGKQIRYEKPDEPVGVDEWGILQ